MQVPGKRLAKPLTDFLLRNRGKILEGLGRESHASRLGRMQAGDLDGERRMALDRSIESFFSCCIRALESDVAEDTDRRLDAWIEETRQEDLELPFLVESVLNLKTVVSGFVMDRLYYKPRDLKLLNQAINAHFDHALFRLTLVCSGAGGTGPGRPADCDPDRAEPPDETLRILSTISHELHTPLASIIGYSEGILEQLDEPEGNRSERVREDLEKVLRNARYLLEIIRNSMEWSRIEVHEALLERRQFDMRECVLEVLAMVSGSLNDKDIRAVLRAPDDVPRPCADYRRTKQILLNLLTNAIRYTPRQGKIAIELTPWSNGAAENAPAVKVTVIDNGIGIEPDRLPSIFGEFHRGHPSGGGGSEGIGLGLFIARRLVELQGGRIWSKSEPKKGSRFSFTLPTEAPTGSIPDVAPIAADRSVTGVPVS